MSPICTAIPETYYTPPAEAMERVELVRGSSSLQFGPQFGGVIDYVLRDGAPNSSLSVRARETGGSFGMFNSYLSLEGGKDKWTYFAYGQYRSQNGWRPNSDLSQVSAAGKLTYHASDRLSLGPLVLDAAQPHPHARRVWTTPNSRRCAGIVSLAQLAREPLEFLALDGDYELSASTRITSSLSLMSSQRYLVWRNEDGGASAIEWDRSGDRTSSSRASWSGSTSPTSRTRRGSCTATSSSGNHTRSRRASVCSAALCIGQEGGPGSTGSDFDMHLVGGPYETDMKFGNFNAAAFAENEFHVTPKLSITPGRAHRISSLHGAGHTDTTVVPQAEESHLRALRSGRAVPDVGDDQPLCERDAGVPSDRVLVPHSVREPHPHRSESPGSKGLQHRPRMARLARRRRAVRRRASSSSSTTIASGSSRASTPTGAPFTERTNVATSTHRGIEAYVNCPLTSLAHADPSAGALDVFDALGYTHARYTSGEFAGNAVEFAPAVVNRAGITYALGRGSVGVQWSWVSRQFTMRTTRWPATMPTSASCRPISSSTCPPSGSSRACSGSISA